MQLAMVTVTVLIPEVRLSILENSQNIDLLKISNFGDLPIRTFGFSRGYTFAMPLYLSLCIAVAIYMKLQYKTKHWLTIPIFLFAILINARIGLVIVPVIFMLCLVYTKPILRVRLIISACTVLLLFFAGNISSSISLKNMNDEAGYFSRFLDSIDDLSNLANGKETGTFNDLSKMNILPTGFDLITGTGKDVFWGDNAKYPTINSDIGYVNDIFFGGVFFSGLIIFVYLYCFQIKTKEPNLKILSYSLILIMLISNYKGSILNSNEFINGYLLLTMLISESIASKEKV
ncbi:hypothetical protein [Chromobacterium violaceum]|uniref:hypothetical protein n=1 Tax=Chromobacterium violaceum TaxID=536 RepID=UPI001B32A041|nr:hypothetical protein [Chromobacterium violaceum]